MITHWYYPGISSIMWVEHLNIEMLQELLVVLEYQKPKKFEKTL